MPFDLYCVLLHRESKIIQPETPLPARQGPAITLNLAAIVTMQQAHSSIDAPALPPVTTSLWRKTLRTISALMLREMTTTYGRSPGGYLWALLEPIGGIAMLTFVFSVGLKLRAPSLGISFPMFYATGMMAFVAYVRLQQSISKAITYSRPLLHFPAVTLFDALAARFLVALVTHGMVMLIVLSSMTVIFETRVVIDPYSIFMAVSMAAALGLGIGTLNALLMPMFPIYAAMWGILTTPLFFMSGILYLYEELPSSGQSILWYNPLVHVTAMMRRGFYAQYDGSFVYPGYVFAISAVLFLVGYILLARNYRAIVDQSF